MYRHPIIKISYDLYKIVYKDSADNLIKTIDNINIPFIANFSNGININGNTYVNGNYSQYGETITINSDNVILDFDNHVLRQINKATFQTSGSLFGVLVKTGKNKISIVGDNGGVQDIAGWGIKFEGPHDTVKLQGITITGCGSNNTLDGAIEIGVPFSEKEAEQLFDHMYNLRCSVSGRSLWQLGKGVRHSIRYGTLV